MTTAVILAAGAGSRLGELGRRYSKPLVPIAGRPLIEWVIARLHTAGIERIVVVGHASDSALATFINTVHADISLVVQSERRGIADALRLALPQVADEAAYLACACDSVFAPDDIAKLIACGQSRSDRAVVGVEDLGIAATLTRSTVRVDGEHVLEIVEKPRRGTAVSGLVALPLYWLPRALTPYIDRQPRRGAEAYVTTALNHFIRAGGMVRAVPMRGRIEITTAEDVERAERRLTAAPDS